MTSTRISDFDIPTTPVPASLHQLAAITPSPRPNNAQFFADNKTDASRAAPTGPTPAPLSGSSTPAMGAIPVTVEPTPMTLGGSAAPATPAAAPLGVRVETPGAVKEDPNAQGDCCSYETERGCFGLGCVMTTICVVVGLGFFIFGIWVSSRPECDRSTSALCDYKQTDGYKIVYGVAILTVGLLALFYIAYRCCCPIRGKQWLDRNGCHFCADCCRASECEHSEATLAYGGKPLTPQVVDQRHKLATGQEVLPVAMPASPHVLPAGTGTAVVVKMDQKVANTPRAGGTTPRQLSSIRTTLV